MTAMLQVLSLCFSVVWLVACPVGVGILCMAAGSREEDEGKPWRLRHWMLLAAATFAPFIAAVAWAVVK